MSDTPHLSLPLLSEAQAQKHVTMNEALTRLDALSAPVAESADVADPPAGAVDGETYIIASPATGEWAGREDDIAFWSNGGWSFAAPGSGRRVWVKDVNAPSIWTGTAWISGGLAGAEAGAATASHVSVGDEAVPAGGGFDAVLSIPDRAIVLGVTARVTADLSGAGLSGWRLGVAGSPDRYGSSIGLAKDSLVNGVTGSPVAYYADTPIRIEPEGGDFAGGQIRIAIHYLALTPPDAV